MDATAGMLKCARSDSLCVVGIAMAIKRDGRLRCSDACAGCERHG